MKPTEFAYWLKGALEFNKITELTNLQLKEINLVLHVVKQDNKDPLNNFVNWLQGGLALDDCSQSFVLNDRQTKALKFKLYEELDNLNNGLSPIDSNYNQGVYPPGVMAKC